MKLGIVTISYNQAKYFQEAIESVTVADYVVVDPGSTDGSREIIEKNRDRFARVILEPDRGPADGLNKGFAGCDADVYGYLNSDDRFVPGALDYVAEYFRRHTQVDLLLGAIRIIDERGKPSLRGRAPDRMDPRKFAARACFAWQQATFFRRELFERVGGFNPENRGTWDAELALQMTLPPGARIGYTDIDSRRFPHLCGIHHRFRKIVSDPGSGIRAIQPLCANAPDAGPAGEVEIQNQPRPAFQMHFRNPSSANSRSSIEWAAVTQRRSRAEPMGTAGNRIGVTKMPNSRSRPAISAAAASSLRITGIIGVSE